MSSVLYSRGVNSQGNNPLRNEMNRIIGLTVSLENRVNLLERELETAKKALAAGSVGPAGPAGAKGDTGPAGPAGPAGSTS